MTLPHLSIPAAIRPGLRAAVVPLSAVVIVGSALAVSATVSDHLAQAAVDEAVGSTEAVVRAYVEPLVTQAGFQRSGEPAAHHD